MWFKQVKIFQFKEPVKNLTNHLLDKLTAFSFHPCLPSTFSSMGWIAPVMRLDHQDQTPLMHVMNGFIMICAQIEEKILPLSVIRYELDKKIKEIMRTEDRKVGQKEKLRLKDEIIITLLPRSFSKYTQIYAYIDLKNNQLLLNSQQNKKIEQFITLFKKSITTDICPLEVTKLSSTFTHWLKNQNYFTTFSIEKTCVLQDPQQQNHLIRCQQQNLFANSIQSLLKEGCEVKKIALSWQDRVHFILTDSFSLQHIKFNDEITSQANDMEAETIEQHFNVDFLIMTETLTNLINDLLLIFNQQSQPIRITEQVN